MAKPILVIGNKNYSSWSLRPYMALKQAGILFDEQLIPFGEPAFGKAIRKISGAGQVPVLLHGKTMVWDSLAILEYVAEQWPESSLWPKQAPARAMARSMCAEMHAGFKALRNACPMNIRRPASKISLADGVMHDVLRIEKLWEQSRANFGKGGPFLFGKFSNADAMFAPVATRFRTYDIKVSRASAAYVDAILSSQAYVAWAEAALQESWIYPADEVD